MAGDSSESKTERATPRRLREARRRGRVARSTELSSATSLLCTLLCVIALAPWAGRRLAALDLVAQASLASGAVRDLAHVQGLVEQGLWLMSGLSMIPLAVAGLAHLASSWLQTGAVFSLELVRPQLERVDPVAGAKRLFALRALVQAGLMTIKLGIIATAAFLVCRGLLGDAVRVAHADASAALAVADKGLSELLLWCGGLFALIGLADLAYQRWQYLRDLRMSPSEVRREQKQDQGDGRLKSRRLRFAQEPVPREQLEFMHLATLVLWDGGGRAIAIVHRPERHPLPMILVHGEGELGADILRLAQRRRVPVVLDASLLAALHPTARPGLSVAAGLLDATLAHLHQGSQPSPRPRPR